MKELENLKGALVEPSTSPMEPETRKRDDAATSREGELEESGVSGEKGGEKDGGPESLDSKGDPSKSAGSEPASVVKSSVKEAEPVVAASPGCGDATTVKRGGGV